MTEIQEAFEKWADNRSGYSYSFEKWNPEWVNYNRGNDRNYASMVVEADFQIFKAGWEAAKNV